MIKISNNSELAFNLIQMSGAISVVIHECKVEDLIEHMQLFNPEIVYQIIQQGDKDQFQKLLLENSEILLIDLTAIDTPKSYLDVLVQLRDKLNDEHKLILLANQIVYDEIEKDFEQLKGYGLDIYSLMDSENESKSIIQNYEKKYSMSSADFLERWKAGEIEDIEDFNKWYVLL